MIISLVEQCHYTRITQSKQRVMITDVLTDMSFVYRPVPWRKYRKGITAVIGGQVPGRKTISAKLTGSQTRAVTH